MKVAIIGRGKTGGRVQENLSDSEILGVYGREDFPSVDQLRKASVAIVFVPGESFLEIIPQLIEANIPVVSGATGFVPPADLATTLSEKNLTWIFGSNFALGMNVFFLLNERLNQLGTALPNPAFSMIEKHHTKKLDAPSGSALSIQSYYDKEMPIESVREGDIVGYHEVTCRSEGEEIKISHNALDRSIFAKGAVWAARQIESKSLEPGLYNFTEIVAQQTFGGGKNDK